MKYYTTEEIRSGYEQKRDWERQFPVSYYIFRPLSFPLTSFLSRFTNSPQALAWFGLCVGAAACVLLAMRGPFGTWPGLFGLALFAILDAADGNMARATGSVTRYGKLLDGALGKLVEGLYLPAMSSGLYFCGEAGFPAADETWVLLSGFIALAAMLYSSYIESAYDSLRPGPVAADPNARIGSSSFRGNPLYTLFINMHAFNLQLVLLAAAALAGLEAAFLLFLMSYYLFRMAATFTYFLVKGRIGLK